MNWFLHLCRALWRLPAWLASAAVRFYQLFLSPAKLLVFGPGCGCRFQPTCSCYARGAFKRFGFWRGLFLASRRILRCHPWGGGGYDPLPDLKTGRETDISAPFTTHFDG